MKYFKVLIKEVYTYEVLVRAKDYADAKDQAMNAEWDDAIGQEAYVDEVVELEELNS